MSREGVGSEWHLDKAQNFLAQFLAARRSAHGAKQHLSRQPLHLFKRALNLTPVDNGRTQPLVLLAGQGHTEGFTPDFTRPLVAGSARPGSPVLHVAFTNPAYFGQRRLEPGVLRLPAG